MVKLEPEVRTAVGSLEGLKLRLRIRPSILQQSQNGRWLLRGIETNNKEQEQALEHTRQNGRWLLRGIET